MKSRKSDEPIENIYAGQISKLRNRINNLKKKVKKAQTENRRIKLEKEIYELRSIIKISKIKLQQYRKLQSQLEKQKQKEISKVNNRSKFSSIKAIEISGGLPSLGKKR